MAYEERWHEIFISSTSEDLGDIREKLILSTITAGHIPSAMELFKVTGNRTIDMIHRYLKRADVFVIIVGSRWGTEIGSTGKSFMEYELETAIENKKNILAFLMEKTESGNMRANLPRDSTERDHETDYQRLRTRVQTNEDNLPRPVVEFSKYDDLPELYALNLEEAIKKLNGKGGWVKGELYDKSMIHLNESVSKNRFFERFVDRLNKFDILSSRCSLEEPLKMAIANVFLDQYLARMIENGVRHFFFESGSSVALVAEAFIERLNTEKWLRDISDNIYI